MTREEALAILADPNASAADKARAAAALANPSDSELTTLVGETIIVDGQSYQVTGQQIAQLGAAAAGLGTAIPGSPLAAEQQGKPAGFIIQDSTGQQFLLPAGTYVTFSGKAVIVDDSGNLTASRDATTKELNDANIPAEPSVPQGLTPMNDPTTGTVIPGMFWDKDGNKVDLRSALGLTGAGTTRTPGGSSREIAPGILGIFDGNGNIIGYTSDPTFESTADREARQATMLQQLQAALRNAMLNKDLGFTEAMDIYKEEQGRVEKAADVSTARGPTKLKALQSSIPGGVSLMLPGLGPDGGIGPAPVHQFESREDLFKTIFPGPSVDEIAAGAGPLPTPPAQPTTEDLINDIKKMLPDFMSEAAPAASAVPV